MNKSLGVVALIAAMITVLAACSSGDENTGGDNNDTEKQNGDSGNNSENWYGDLAFQSIGVEAEYEYNEGDPEVDIQASLDRKKPRWKAKRPSTNCLRSFQI